MIGQRVIREATSDIGARYATIIHLCNDMPVVMYNDGRVEIAGWRELTFCDPESVKASLNPGGELSGDGEVTLER